MAIWKENTAGQNRLIVKLQKECQTLKREPDGKPPCGIEPEIIAKLARTSARIYELGISFDAQCVVYGRGLEDGKLDIGKAGRDANRPHNDLIQWTHLRGR